jgi:hypothetical protein
MKSDLEEDGVIFLIWKARTYVELMACHGCKQIYLQRDTEKLFLI